MVNKINHQGVNCSFKPIGKTAQSSVELGRWKTERSAKDVTSIFVFLGKVDNGKFPKLENMELLTMDDTNEANIGKNTTGVDTSILAECQSEHEIKKARKGEIDGTDSQDK